MGFEGGESAMRVCGCEGWDMLGYGQEVEVGRGRAGGEGLVSVSAFSVVGNGM